MVIEDQPIRSIAISTGGGDAPGLNAVIRAAVLAAENRGWNVWGIRDGFHGLMEPEAYGGQGVFRLTRQSVAGISHLGGTILGTSNRGTPFAMPREGGGTVDRSAEIIDRLQLELTVIEKTGFISYFLITADFVAKGREMGVACVARVSEPAPDTDFVHRRIAQFPPKLSRNNASCPVSTKELKHFSVGLAPIRPLIRQHDSSEPPQRHQRLR